MKYLAPVIGSPSSVNPRISVKNRSLFSFVEPMMFGPAARAMLPVRAEMIDLGEAKFEERTAEDLNDVLVPLVKADLGLFTADELRIVNQVFEEMRPFNAKAISDHSHLKSAGWKVVGLQEDIPYEAAFVVTDPPSAEAIERGRELAAKYGW